MANSDPLPEATRRERRNAALRRRRRREAMGIVHCHATCSAAANFIPIPILDSVVVAGVQMAMLRELARYYRKPFDAGTSRVLISSFGAGFVHFGASRTSVAQQLASQVASIPVIGGFLRWGAWSGVLGAYTYLLGRNCVDHIELGGDFKNMSDSAWARMPLNPMVGL